MIEIAIVTDEIALDLQEALKHGFGFGIKKYELRCLGSYEKRIPYVDQTDLDLIDKLLNEKKIEITALSPGTFKIMAGEKEKLNFELKKTLPDTCKLAKKFGAEKIITFGFMRDETTEKDIIEILKQAGKIAAEYDLILAIENEPGAYCDTAANTLRVIEAINMPNVKINWDPGNAVSSGETAYPTGYDLIKDHMVNLHIKDTVLYPKNEMKLLNDGGVNWLGQLHAIISEKRLPYITLETHVFPLLESTTEDMKRLKILLEAVEKLME